VPTFLKYENSLFSANYEFAFFGYVPLWGMLVSQNEEWDSLSCSAPCRVGPNPGKEKGADHRSGLRLSSISCLRARTTD
jgi:hypothetical protein